MFFVITITGSGLRNISQKTLIEYISPRASVRKKPYRVQGGADNDSRCRTRVYIVCQIPMLCL